MNDKNDEYENILNFMLKFLLNYVDLCLMKLFTHV